jgi:transcriptional regulator with XRE-family HTH domain
MVEQIKLLAERIKGLREIAGISVETMAKKSGTTIEQYTAFESGSIDIPVSLLLKIAHNLNVDLSAILSGENPRLHVYCIVRNGKGLSVERRKQYKYENLAHNFVNKQAEPFIVTVEPSSKDVIPNSHEGQEFNFILEGSVKITIDGHEIVLNEGDSIYFDSSYEHSLDALNNKTARLLAVVIKKN